MKGRSRFRLAPGKGTLPSRPRPWQVVAVAETAEGAGSGVRNSRHADLRRSAARGRRNGRGRLTGAQRNSHRGRSLSQGRPGRLTSSRLPPAVQTRCMKRPHHGVVNPCSALRALETAAGGTKRDEKCAAGSLYDHNVRRTFGDTTSSSQIEAPGSPFPAGRSRKDRVRVGLPQHPPHPSRPGRLVAASACPGRHETPGTQLGRPQRPEARRPTRRSSIVSLPWGPPRPRNRPPTRRGPPRTAR
jgi:hypothetical protein